MFMLLLLLLLLFRLAQAQTFARGQDQLAQLEERETALRQIEVSILYLDTSIYGISIYGFDTNLLID